MASKDMRSCLHAVAQRGPLQLLVLLLRHGADVQVWTPPPPNSLQRLTDVQERV